MNTATPFALRPDEDYDRMTAERVAHYEAAYANAQLDELAPTADDTGLDAMRRKALDRLPFSKRVLHSRCLPFQSDIHKRLVPWRGESYPHATEAIVVLRDPRAIIPAAVPEGATLTKRDERRMWWREVLLLYSQQRRDEQALRAVRALMQEFLGVRHTFAPRGPL